MQLAYTIRDAGVFSWAGIYKHSINRINWLSGPSGSWSTAAAGRRSKTGAGRRACVNRPITNGSASYLT